MKDILQDLVAHTHALGFISLVKISSVNGETIIEANADDRSVVIQGKTKSLVPEFDSVFGMPNLNKLDIHLKCPEYKTNATISVVKDERDGEVIPTGLHFINESGDFQNDYRFMYQKFVDEKLKSLKYKTPESWALNFVPSMSSIQRLKFQQTAHSEELMFKASTNNDNLVLSFGNISTHAGSFVFEPNAGKLKQILSWPVAQTISILSLPGDITIKISENPGAMQITVDSGLAEYNYILPVQAK